MVEDTRVSQVAQARVATPQPECGHRRVAAACLHRTEGRQAGRKGSRSSAGHELFITFDLTNFCSSSVDSCRGRNSKLHAWARRRFHIAIFLHTYSSKLSRISRRSGTFSV